jgi:peroxiredoxin
MQLHYQCIFTINVYKMKVHVPGSNRPTAKSLPHYSKSSQHLKKIMIVIIIIISFDNEKITVPVHVIENIV